MTCDAYWEAKPPVNRMADMCKNITLPQTLFAGSSKLHITMSLETVPLETKSVSDLNKADTADGRYI